MLPQFERGRQSNVFQIASQSESTVSSIRWRGTPFGSTRGFASL
ncbi:protein of unknown function (plasmid) [Vibrio harveyi]|nr:protein of unknown function [Vibrio harveyi]